MLARMLATDESDPGDLAETVCEHIRSIAIVEVIDGTTGDGVFLNCEAEQSFEHEETIEL